MRVDIQRAREKAVRSCQAAGAGVEEAEDAVHDAVLALLENPDVRKPEAWISTVSRRRWIDHVRRNARERTALGRELNTATHALDPAEVVTDREQAKWLVDSLGSLPRTTRAICWAVGMGRSREQIARDLSLSPRAVESHLTRARRSLKRLRALTALPVAASLQWLSNQRPSSAAVVRSAAMVPVAAGLILLPPQSKAPASTQSDGTSTPSPPATSTKASPSPSKRSPEPLPDTAPIPVPAVPVAPQQPVRPTMPPTVAPRSELSSLTLPILPALPVPDLPEGLPPLVNDIPSLPPRLIPSGRAGMNASCTTLSVAKEAFTRTGLSRVPVPARRPPAGGSAAGPTD